MTKKRILFVPSIIKKRYDAPVNRVINLLKHKPSELEMYVIAQEEFGLSKIQLDGLEVIKTNNSSPFKHLIIATQIFFKAIKLLREDKINYIYVRHGINTLATLLLAKIFHKKLIVEIHALFSIESNLRKDFLFDKLLKGLDYLAIKYSDTVVTVSDITKNQIIQKYKLNASNIIVVPNGVDTTIFKPLHKRRVRKELGLDQYKKYLLFFGTFAVWQGIENILKVSKEFGREVVFIFVGEGELKNMIYSYKQRGKNIVIVGPQEKNIIPKYINAVDAILAPFPKNERNNISGFSPLKIIESMACNKIIITSPNCGGMKKDIVESNSGIIVDNPDNIDMLYKGIIEGLNKKKKINGRKRVIRKYTWDLQAKKVYNLFR